MAHPHELRARPRRRRRIDHKVISELLAERDVSSVTMAEIAARAGVAKPTLYKLAGSKQQLVDACLDAEAERLIGCLHETVTAEAGVPVGAAVLAAVARFAADSPGGFALLFERRTDGAIGRIRRAESGLAALMASNSDPEIAAAAALGAAGAAVSRFLADREQKTSRVIDVAALQRAAALV